MSRPPFVALSVVVLLCLSSCDRPHGSPGEQLARRHCSPCHAFPEPELLDKATWQEGVLPQMAPRLGIQAASLFDESARNPNMVVLTNAVSRQDWDRIVAYYRDAAPAALPRQSLPAQPQLDPDFFATAPFAPRIESSGIVTVLEADSVHERVFVGDAGTNTLHVLAHDGRLLSSLKLDSPPTDLVVDGEQVLILESGILHP